MTYAKRNFDRHRRLSQLEVAALTQEVLERARRSLRENRDGVIPAPNTDRRAEPRPETGIRDGRPGQTVASARPWFRSQLAWHVRKDFEWFTIAFCVIFSGMAWFIQSSGAYS